MRKLIIFCFAFLILTLNLVYASVDINIDMKSNFKIGETASFNYTFLSDSNEKITYAPEIKCTDGYQSLLMKASVQLYKGIPFKDNFEGFTITDKTNLGQCLASIKIESPFIKIKEQVFEIGEESQINFNLKICEQKSCVNESGIFLKNKRVYFNYYSDVSDLNLKTALTYPSGKTKSLKLPTYIKASEIGTYTIEATASKEGYKSIAKTEQFGVIEENAEISDSSTGTTKTTDKSSSGQPISSDMLKSEMWKWVWVLVALLSLIIGLIIVLVLLRRRER